VADFAPDPATGLEADAAAKAGTTPALRQGSFYNVIVARFASGSKLVLFNGTGTQVEIPMPAGTLQGSTLRFPAFTGTALANGPADVDNGTWFGRIVNGTRYLDSVSTPRVGRTAPAAIRIGGGSTSSGVIEVPVGTSSFAMAETVITLPQLSDFGGTAGQSNSGGPCALAIINAPTSIPINETLTYTLSLTSGSSTGVWQTWLLTETGTGGSTGEGAVAGQRDSVGGGPSGVYTKSISNLAPGDYWIWAKVNDGGACQNSWVKKAITLLPSTGGGDPSDWRSNGIYVVSGSFIAESNGMSGAEDQGLGFKYFGLDAGDPNIMKVGIGSTVGNSQVASFRIEANIPTTSRDPTDNVRGYPSVGMGQQGGWGDTIPESGTWWDNIPARVSDIDNGWTGYKSLSLSSTCKGHAAHDMRFTTSAVQTYGNKAPDPNSVIAMEWLLQIQSIKGYASHPDGKTPAWYRGSVDIDGFTWHMYLQYGAQTVLFQWIPDEYPAPNWINLGAMIDYMRNTRFRDLPNGEGSIIRRNATRDSFIIEGAHYFISNVIGFEICGPGALRMEVDSATLRINKDY
jgi:hypothetical protein